MHSRRDADNPDGAQARERRSSDRHRSPQGRETAYRRSRTSAGTRRRANVSAARSPNPGWRHRPSLPYPGPRLFHVGGACRRTRSWGFLPVGASALPPMYPQAVNSLWQNPRGVRPAMHPTRTTPLRSVLRCVSVEIHPVFLPHAPRRTGASPPPGELADLGAHVSFTTGC